MAASAVDAMDVNAIIDKLLDVRGARPGKQGACPARLLASARRGPWPMIQPRPSGG